MSKNEQDKIEIHSFDFQYLKSITEDLQAEVKKRGEVMWRMETHMATTNLILKQLKEKNDEQDDVQKEHAIRIHSVEITQAKCDAAARVRHHDIELKRLNAFMDMARRGSSGKINTESIVVHQQQLQAAAEAAIVNSISMKDHIFRSWPIIALICIFCVVVTTLIMARSVTGEVVDLPSMNDIPGVKLDTNIRFPKMKKTK